MEIAKTLGISSGTVRRTIARMRNEHGDDWGRHDPAMAPPKPTVSADVHDTPEQLAALARETLAWAMIYGRERDLGAAVRAAVFVSQQAESRDPAIDTLVTDDALDQLRLAIERATPGTPRIVDDDEGLTPTADRIQ